jgi:NhaA family Na+:H+ antiporter
MPYLKLAYLLRPFEDFFKRQASGGILLIAATAVALLLANSPLSDAYFHFWEIELTVGFDRFGLTKTLHLWINDGLMAVFFFVVGLEIKREFLAGELAGIRKAALPFAAAIGGMLVPALIFFLLNPRPPQVHGWGIPMATDIAFALGVIALLGDRVPRALAIFLTALAIVDDLGAVLVIAVFYSGEISPVALGVAAAFFLLLVVGNRVGLKHPNYYALVGFAFWVALLKSGVHASIAGVLIGATIPVRPRHSHDDFLARTNRLLQRYREIETIEGPFLHEERQGILLAMENVCHETMSPLQRMEHVMNPWVIFGVMPIFALANAGVRLDAAALPGALTNSVTLGIIFGLLLGKPLGIFIFSWLAVRLRLCDIPAGVSWRQVLGAGILGGIGFTMSLFITSLAFADPALVTNAKIGIFAASLLAGLSGFWLLRQSASVGTG